MQYTQLGRAGVQVSRLCLGTMNFGWQTSEADSFTIMDRALELGINFFDTANVYGGSERGLTELIIGRWLAQGGGRREKIVLATKLYINMEEWPTFGKLSAVNIRRACEASLRRLQTDHIDLYQFHRIDRTTTWDEIWEAMEILVQQGKVIYAGSSNFAGWHIAQASERAQRRNFLGLVSEQCVYNLHKRTVELEVLPAAQAYGLGVLPWSPLAGGLLAGAPGALRAKAAQGRRAQDSTLQRIEQHGPQLQAYEALCAELGEHPADVALAWLLAQPAVTAPVIGPRAKEQLDGLLHALEIALTPETLQKLDALFPGPGGQAPEAYMG